MPRARLLFLLALPAFAHAAVPPNEASADIAARPAPIALPHVYGPRRAPLIVIDPGHGGHDPGSNNGGRKEKDAALAIARAIRDEIVAAGRLRVALTREDDRFLVLAERREIARRLDADLFLSIHADSAPNRDARGATVYTLSDTSSDMGAARVAAKENRADVVNGVDLAPAADDVSTILVDLARRETTAASSTFAERLRQELAPVVPFKSGFHKFAGFLVLKAPDVPSVLLETGYISNDADLKLLFSRDYQHQIALGVRRAAEAYFAPRLIHP